MAALWRIRIDGKVLGPYPYKVLHILRSQGRLPPNTQAQHEGALDWIPADAAFEYEVQRPPPLPPMPPPPLPPALPQPRAHFARRDEAPAPQTRRGWFGIGCFVLIPLVLLTALGYFARERSETAFDPRPWLGCWSLVCLCAVLHWLASSWWLWRRTAALTSEPQRVLLRGASVLYGLSVVAIVFAQKALVFDEWRFATRTDPYRDFTFSVEDGGHAIVFEGDMGFEATERFRRLLSENPDADTLVLNSRGGWVATGRGFAAVLAESRLDTVVVRNRCMSACILAFESARRRVLEQGASLGFHSASSDLFPATASHEKENKEFIEIMNKRRVPEEFVDKVIRTPPDQMWIPSDAELFNNHMIDAVRIDRQDLPAKDYFRVLAHDALAAPPTAGLYESLRAFDPQAYADVRTALAEALARGESAAGLAAIGQEVLAAPQQKAFEHGGDQAQLHRARYYRQLFVRLRQTSPAGCDDLWNDGAAPPTLELSQAEKDDFITTLSELMRSASLRRHGSDERAPDRQVLLEAFGPAMYLYGDAVFHTTAEKQAGHLTDDDICVIAIATMSKIVRLPPAEAGAVMRWMSSPQ